MPLKNPAEVVEDRGAPDRGQDHQECPDQGRDNFAYMSIIFRQGQCNPGIFKQDQKFHKLLHHYGLKLDQTAQDQKENHRASKKVIFK